MIFEKGDFIQNKYQVDTIVHSDNEGVIYNCKYRKGYKIVKQIFSSEDKKPDNVDKLFSDRCSELKKLNHRNLVLIDDFFIEDRSYFVVMEQIKGKTLEEIYRDDYKGRAFPSDVLMQYMLKVCDGLKYMHGQSPPVLYGALAPEKVITGGGGIVKLLNYGLGSTVRYGFNKGVNSFAAPEQTGEKKDDMSSDIYGIASLMYYLLSGKKYEAGTKKIETLMSSNKNVSKNLAELIAKCLSKKISNRPDTGDFSRQLSKLYLSETVLKATRGFSMASHDEEEDEISPSEKEESSVEPEKSKKEISEISGKAEKSKKEESEISVEEKDRETDSAPAEIEEEKKKKKKKKKKKTVTDELKDTVGEEAGQIEIVEDREETDRAEEEAEPDIKPEDVKSEQPESPESDVKEKKKKKKKKKKESLSSVSEEVISSVSEEVKEEFDEITEEYEELDEVADIDTLDSKEEIAEISEVSEKKESKPSLKTSSLSMQLLSVIKQKEEEDVEEVMEETEEETEEEVTEEIKEDSKEEIKKDSVPVPGQIGKDGKKLTRKSSIADFLRNKSGLTEEEYEVNKDLVLKGRRKSGLSEEFLASLKATSGSSSIKTGADVIKDVSFPFYKKPSEDPPCGVYEEVDMLKNNRYEVRELLQKDCYGGIYTVQDYDEQDDDKSTKILKDIQYKGTNPEKVKSLIDKFQKVCEKLTKLNHAGLVKIEDYFYTPMDNGAGVRFSLIMEYIEGMSFNEVARTYYSEDAKSQLPAKTVFGVISKVYSSLEYLHNNGVVCGDIRPSNLILTSDGNIKFLNYGLASIFYGLTDEVYPFKGVYGYVAPELRCLPDGDFKSDIFSLGAVMYFMLTGSNPEDISYKFQPIRKLNPFLSLQVERFIQSLLNYTPSNRPEIGQIIRVMDSINFFEVVKTDEKDKKSESDVKEKNTEKLKPPPPKPLDPRIKKILLPVISVIGLIILYIGWVYGQGYLSKIFVKSYPPSLLYGTEENSDIHSVDLNTMKINTVTIPSCFKDIAYSDKSKFFYGLDFSGEKLVEFDLHTRKILRTVKTGKEPSNVTLSLHKDIAYITNNRADSLSIIDMVKFKEIKTPLIGSGPVKSILSSDGRTLCVLNQRQRSLSYVNIRDNSVIGTSVLDAEGTDLAFSNDNSKVYVLLNSTDKLVSISVSTRNITKTLSIPSGPVGVVALHKVNKIYVITDKSKELLLVDPEEGIKHSVSLEFIPMSISISPDADEKMIFIKGRSLSGYVIAIYNRVTKECKVLSQPSKEPLFMYPVYSW